MKLFEQSWEVCNKVGGIYTVISTKAKYIIRNFGRENYFLIGPYKDTSEFIEDEKPSWIKDIEEKIKKDGIHVYYGYWDIDGKPNTILIDFYEFFNKQRDYWKYMFWEWYKIDSLYSDFTFDEPLLWSIAVGKFLENINEKFILHSHEWLSGGTILYLKAKKKDFYSVFTIHGTVVGRSISERKYDILDVYQNLDIDRDSYRLGVHFKHQLEKSTVLNTDVFTVVSDVLKEESKIIFKRNPNYITYNYLDINEEKYDVLYMRSLKNLYEFLYWYFYPYYKINFDEYIFIYTLGRYEFYNKGYDIFIDLLDHLRKNNVKTIAFIFVPYQNNGVNKKVFRLYKKFIEMKKIIYENNLDIYKSILEKNFEFFERLSKEFSSYGNPPISTHDVDNEIYNELVKRKFNNDKEDPVKVVYAPIYLGQDIIFYYNQKEILPAFDFGIFLSRYEPYGYTPLEALSYGNLIVLSEKTGFYKAILNKKLLDENIIITFRFYEGIEKTFPKIFEYYNRSLSERFLLKERAYKLSLNFSWDKNIDEYLNIYKNFI